LELPAGTPVTHFHKGQGYVIFVGGDSLFQALDAKTGVPLWKSTASVGGLGATDPLMMSVGGVQVGTAYGNLVTLNAETGELAWEVSLLSESGFLSRPYWNWY
jgi:outer membrane protein assembly factor BamB